MNKNESITLLTVNSKKDLRSFYKVPWTIYKNDENWVPPLWLEFKDFFKKNNPFWVHAEKKLFLIRKNGLIVGRIAAIIDHKYIETIGKKIGFFGFFECIDDFNCAKVLFKSAEDWLVSRKMNVMRGPINGRVDVGCGFLETGFNSTPGLLSSYSPQYYLKFADRYEMKKARDQLLYFIDLKKSIPKKLEEKAKKCIDTGIKVRRFNRIRTNKELNLWIDLFLETFTEHWGFIPAKREEVKMRFGVKHLRWIVDSKLFLIAEYKGSPVAYIWSTPDYNQVFQKLNGKLGTLEIIKFLFMKRYINKGKLPLIGIKKEYRDKNIASYLNYLTLIEMKKRGYVGAEVGWIDEKNSSANATISITGAKLYKKFRVFDKDIGD
ncbi:hypothetical protein AYK21_05020 [Thermoplasmatales archaeon SG8-52-2]|nr:MAG: hypothetical protein AYK21_05020 [Thermoplasmatales archaeon SG8-52-2]